MTIEKIKETVGIHFGMIEVDVSGAVKLKLNPGKPCLTNKLKMMNVASSR